MTVKATLIPWTEPPMDLIKDRWHGPPGAFIQQQDIGPCSWRLCCPNCGELGAPRTGARWIITKGSFEDVGSLTLSPSIQVHCCGWHGYLVNGIFQLTPEGV